MRPEWRSSFERGDPRLADQKETERSATARSARGNPTGPKAQGLLSLPPPISLRSQRLKNDAEHTEPLSEEEQSQRDHQKRKGQKRNLWPLKVTIITLVLSAFFSFSTEIISSKSNLVVALLICIFLILISIIFDGIGVAATNCDIKPLTAMAAKKVPGSRVAIRLVQNSEKVSSICCDVIGDICGVISGACSAAIVLRIVTHYGSGSHQLLISIIASALIAAITVGGKAIEKTVAIRNSKDLIMLTARFLALFSKEERRDRKNAAKKNQSSR